MQSNSAKRFQDWPDVIATGACGILGLVGFLIQQLSFEHAYASSLVFLIAAYVAGGFRTLMESISSLTRGELKVDTLMIIAAVGAAILGDWVEGSILLFLFSLSNTLEKFASYRTNRSIESLIQLRPRNAHRMIAGSQEDELVEVEALKLGDKVRIKPGERFPIDGQVVEGESWADESTLTGESRPVPKRQGDDVFSGTLNSQGSVLVKMTKLIEDSQ
jgi:Zn2+/Cd2+-exporting ATPase